MMNDDKDEKRKCEKRKKVKRDLQQTKSSGFPLKEPTPLDPTDRSLFPTTLHFHRVDPSSNHRVLTKQYDFTPTTIDPLVFALHADVTWVQR